MINLAVIGAGRFGTNYIRTISTMKGVRVTHVCVKHSRKHADIADKYILLTDYRKLLSMQEIDGVIIATPASTHAEIARSFIERKIPVLIEKPFTTSLQDAQNLYLCWKREKGIVFIGHIYLYNPAFVATTENIKKIGKIEHIDAQAGNWGPVRKDTTILWDWMVHDVVMVNQLLKKSPISVQAFSDKFPKFDFLSIKLLYPQNISVLLSCSWKYPQKIRRTTILGSRGVFVFDDISSKKITFLKKDDSRLVEQSSIKYSDVSPLTEQINAFINSIRTKKDPLTDIKQGLLVAHILDAAERSLSQDNKIIPITRV